jgi:hypothetical protein
MLCCCSVLATAMMCSLALEQPASRIAAVPSASSARRLGIGPRLGDDTRAAVRANLVS